MLLTINYFQTINPTHAFKRAGNRNMMILRFYLDLRIMSFENEWKTTDIISIMSVYDLSYIRIYLQSSIFMRA